MLIVFSRIGPGRGGCARGEARLSSGLCKARALILIRNFNLGIESINANARKAAALTPRWICYLNLSTWLPRLGYTAAVRRPRS